MNIKKLKPGMLVWSVGRYGVGNTTMRSVAAYPVKIIEVDEGGQRVTACWNHNPAQVYTRHSWSKWRLAKPLLIKLGFNHYRLATRDEIKAAKAAGTSS